MSEVLENQTRPEKERLCLVLDLDNTLLESRNVSHFNEHEKESLLAQDGFFMTGSFVIKLRPFVREFLEKASTMFKMHVFTLGSRQYAMEVVRNLNPDGKYFDGRVVTRDDTPWSDKDEKRLEVAGVDNRLALIVDDREDVWSHHVDNLILISSYEFFEDKNAEDNGEPSLRKVFQILRWVYRLYRVGDERDVRRVLDVARKGVLRGCTIMIDSDLMTDSDCVEFWRQAEAKQGVKSWLCSRLRFFWGR